MTDLSAADLQRETPSTSFVEWLACASLSLATAFVIALTQPGVSRPPPDFPTFVALCLTVLGCALEASAIGGTMLAGSARWARNLVSAVSMIVVLVAGAWLLGRAPGREVLFAWMVVPPTLGICAVSAAGRGGSWAAVAFLAVATALVPFLGARWTD